MPEQSKTVEEIFRFVACGTIQLNLVGVQVGFIEQVEDWINLDMIVYD